MNNILTPNFQMQFAALRRIVVCILAVTGVFWPAMSAAQDPVSSKLEAFIVLMDDNGSESFKKADRVTPGELIEYRIAYKNNTKEALGAFTVNGDVPVKTAYIPGSQKSNMRSIFQAEIVDLGWVEVPAFREIKNQDGTIEKVQVSPDEYENLRWQLAESLASTQEVNVVYRIMVDK